jgi:hypothetical protein
MKRLKPLKKIAPHVSRKYRVGGIEFMATCASDAMVQYLDSIRDYMVENGSRSTARRFDITVEKQTVEWTEWVW